MQLIISFLVACSLLEPFFHILILFLSIGNDDCFKDRENDAKPYLFESQKSLLK